MIYLYKAIPFATTKAVVDANYEAEEVEEGAVMEAPAVVAGVPSECPHPLRKTTAAKAAKMAKMARCLVFATETFWLMVKQRRTTVLPLRRPRRAWPPTLQGPEK